MKQLQLRTFGITILDNTKWNNSGQNFPAMRNNSEQKLSCKTQIIIEHMRCQFHLTQNCGMCHTKLKLEQGTNADTL